MDLSPVLIILSVLAVITNGGVVVKEDSDAVLPCSPRTKENLEKELFVWKKDVTKDRKEVFMYDGGLYYGNGKSGQDKQFEGRVSHFDNELKNGNASIKITETKVSDSGNYTCEFPRLGQKVLIELVVDCILKDRTKEEPGACPEPSVTSQSTKDQVLLQCEVKGASPRPEVEWRNSSGNILHAKEPQVTERGGSYDIILQTTVTKTDHYSCVVTQNEFCHQISSNISVYIHDCPVGWIISTAVVAVVTFVITLGVVVIVLAVLFAAGCISCRKGFLMKMCRHDDMRNNGDVTSDHLGVRVMMQPRSDGEELNEDVTSDLLEETDHMKDIPERNLTDEGFD